MACKDVGAGVNAIVTMEDDASDLLAEAEELGLPVYYMCKDRVHASTD